MYPLSAFIATTLLSTSAAKRDSSWTRFHSPSPWKSSSVATALSIISGHILVVTGRPPLMHPSSRIVFNHSNPFHKSLEVSAQECPQGLSRCALIPVVTIILMAATNRMEHVIELNKLSVPHLAQLRKQHDQEISVLQDSIQTLKVVQCKFSDSKDCLEMINPDSKGKSIMVPLTGSMYVPGKIADSEKVLIDIGTGYYVKMDIARAKDYFKRKVAYVTEEMGKIQAIGVKKSKTRDAIVDALETKIHAQMVEMAASQNATANA